MLRDNLAGLIEPRLATAQHESHRTIDPQCLENPRPVGAESTLTENAPSPFQAEPRHNHMLKLRQKLESDPSHPSHLLTVHGLGYKFVP